MSIFSRLSKGWSIAQTSLSIILNNKSLLLFPMISTISLILILATFFGGGYLVLGDAIANNTSDENTMNIVGMALVFIYYLVNFTVVTFFNVGLIYCATKIFNEEETSIGEGIQFATTKMGKIITWASISATVGLILNILSNDENRLGQIVASLIGTAWTVLTFFVVPIMVFKDMGPIEAIKESGRTVKEKWGESLGGNFSLGLINVLGIIAIAFLAFVLSMVNMYLALTVAIIAAILLFATTSAANVVFVAAVYNNLNELPSGEFQSDIIDDLFISK